MSTIYDHLDESFLASLAVSISMRMSPSLIGPMALRVMILPLLLTFQDLALDLHGFAMHAGDPYDLDDFARYACLFNHFKSPVAYLLLQSSELLGDLVDERLCLAGVHDRGCCTAYF